MAAFILHFIFNFIIKIFLIMSLLLLNYFILHRYTLSYGCICVPERERDESLSHCIWNIGPQPHYVDAASAVP